MTTSVDLTKLGSPSALSLFANAETIPALITAGAVLAVSAAVFTYSEFKSYQAKKHKEKIEEINLLYSLFLKQIIVPNHGRIHGFPPIFQMEDEHKYQSMHFTLEQVKAIGTDVPHGTDVALSSYRESIRAAIRKLKEYYCSRKDGKKIKSDDITAGVISYLLQMLDTKCLNFLGYDYDIAYLDAICKFINAYSSLKNGAKSQHFSRLAPVYAHLLKAKQKLEKHKEVLSLEETVAELRDSCITHSDELIRVLVKMVVKDPDTELADTVAHEELQDGVLRQHYIQSELWGVELLSDYEIHIPDSIFKDWIKNLSGYYLKSLNTDIEQQDRRLNSPKDFFSFLEQAKSLLLRKRLGIFNSNNEIDSQLKLIRKVFRESGNFISTKYNKATKKFEIVSDSLQLIDRSLVMAKVAKLAHEIISLQYLCAHLLKSIQLLGDIYVNNPAHFCKIFDVLDNLCVLIQDEVRATKNEFRQLQADNEHNMQIEEKELFPHQVKDLLESVYAEIKDLGEQVKDCRLLAIKAIKPYTVKSVNYEMLQIATAISSMYFEGSCPPEEAAKEAASSSSSSKHGSASIGSGEPEKSDDETPHTESSASLSNESESPDDLLTRLDDLTEELHERIFEIQKTELFHSRHYFKVYDALMVMRNKSISLIDEPSKSLERFDKANKTLELTVKLAKNTLEFLMQTPEKRHAGASMFFRALHDELSDPSNISFIDRHHNQASRFIYTHLCSYGIFRTDTRKKLAVLEEACFNTSLN